MSLIDSAWAHYMNEKGPMTQDEATEVWRQMHEVIKSAGHSDAFRILCLDRVLASERGKRCSVCARYDDPECATRC